MHGGNRLSYPAGYRDQRIATCMIQHKMLTSSRKRQYSRSYWESTAGIGTADSIISGAKQLWCRAGICSWQLGAYMTQEIAIHRSVKTKYTTNKGGRIGPTFGNQRFQVPHISPRGTPSCFYPTAHMRCNEVYPKSPPRCGQRSTATSNFRIWDPPTVHIHAEMFAGKAPLYRNFSTNIWVHTESSQWLFNSIPGTVKPSLDLLNPAPGVLLCSM